MKLQLKQYLSTLSQIEIDSLEQLVLIVPDSEGPSAWGQFPYKGLLGERFQRAKQRQAAIHPFATDLPNDIGTHVSIWPLKTELSPFEMLGLARKIARHALARGGHQLSIQYQKLPLSQHKPLTDAIVSALYAASWPMTDFKTGKKHPKAIKRLQLYGLKHSIDISRSVATAEGTNIARELTQLPPNVLTPANYRKRLRQLAGHYGWQHRFYGQAQLAQKNAGAFLAVLQASDKPQGGLVHLRYQPTGRKTGKPLALVGKGLCYDTGGVNLKSAKYMYSMHEDMEGSAVALGTLIALTRLKVNFAVDCWLALAVNDIGPKAYRPNEIITASNGTTIEVIHTDAEGRMVLADTLAIACQAKPALIIDYATLTGSCIAALGTAYSGAFTNREELHSDIIAAGRSSGERVWPFPQDKDFDDALKSKVADVKQCTLDGGPDHILAARFLNRFVDETVPWLHIDLAAGNNKGGLAHISTDTTGFGVRFSIDLLMDQKSVAALVQ